MNWLFKEEPSSYNFAAFTKDGRTVWAGVKNPLAQKHLRSVKKGDRIFYYHTGDERAIVGVARAVGDAYPDPQDKTGKRSMVSGLSARPHLAPLGDARVRHGVGAHRKVGDQLTRFHVAVARGSFHVA